MEPSEREIAEVLSKVIAKDRDISIIGGDDLFINGLGYFLPFIKLHHVGLVEASLKNRGLYDAYLWERLEMALGSRRFPKNIEELEWLDMHSAADRARCAYEVLRANS